VAIVHLQDGVNVRECFTEDGAEGCTPACGLAGAAAVTAFHDHSVTDAYVSSPDHHRVTVLRRARTWLKPGCVAVGGEHGCSPAGGIEGVSSAAVPSHVRPYPDLTYGGSHVYTGGATLGVFRRDAATTSLVQQPSPALPVNGPIAVWQRDSGTGDRIEGRSRSAGIWGATSVLSDTPLDALGARVAAGTGGATAVWSLFDGTHWRVESRPWLTGSWRPRTVLSPDDLDGDQPQVAMEETGGEALAVWRRFDGTHYRIETTAGP
jgi:hypothetical protein